MTNAQVGQRILDAAGPDLDEIRAILQDIVKDDRRASDVIQQLRALLRKGDLDMTRIDLKVTIREVVDLIDAAKGAQVPSHAGARHIVSARILRPALVIRN